LLEVYLDFCCPFSRKMWNTVTQFNKAHPEFRFTVQLVPQPWHPQSCILHEFALSVRSIFGDERFFIFCDWIWGDNQSDFFDDKTADKSRKEIYLHLMDGFGLEGGEKVQMDTFLAIGEGNSGNQATQLVKWAVKYHRVRSVHVTPTVFVNGLEKGDISSGWTVEQWKEMLDSV